MLVDTYTKQTKEHNHSLKQKKKIHRKSNQTNPSKD